jgi:hypothetical protein
LIPGRVKLGYTRRSNNTFAGTDGWTHYIQAIVQGNVDQNIHLTDILTTQLLTALQIHVGDPAPEGDSAVTSKNFFTLTLNQSDLLKIKQDSHKNWITVQVGAARAAKAWDAKSWAKLLQYVIHRNPEWGIFLVGGKEDEAKANEILSELAPFISATQLPISLVGESNFDLWTSVISRSQWVFTGDTAAVHLASVLGTRVLNISIGPVKHSETGPYGNGHFVISAEKECPACEKNEQFTETGHTCRVQVTPEAVYSVWTYALHEDNSQKKLPLEKHANHLGWSHPLEQVRVYRSRIRPSQDGGGVVYQSLLKRPLWLNEWGAMVMGHVDRSWYCGWVPAIGQEISRD